LRRRSAADLAGWVNRAVAGAILVFLVLVPPLHVVSGFNLSTIGVRSLWMGIAAASIVFLAGYGGMVSLSQVALYGIAGFTYADLVVKAGWGHWPAIAAGIASAVAVGLVIGAVASRTYGIYFLMLTLAFGVITYYFYLQVEQLSGQTGLHLDAAPSLVGDDPVTHPERLYYAALLVSAVVYVSLRLVAKTPFGLALQGIRDDPVRMRSLGYNVVLHRTLAFAAGALVASLAGILSVFFNLQISPSSIDVSQTIVVLAVAVVGGMNRLEGAWLGAAIYSVIFTYTFEWAAHLPGFLSKPLGSERYPTWLGLVFLLVLIASPGGLMGIWDRLVLVFARAIAREAPTTERSPAPADPTEAGKQRA
jgi:branched-chain amino acid transport system permease protein